MTQNSFFKTKTGFCHVLPDKILLTREEVVGDIAQVIAGNNIARILIIYGALSTVLLYCAYTLYGSQEYLSATLFSLFGLLLGYNIANSLNNSATPVIDRSKIEKVVFKSAIPGITRSHFQVYFLNDAGQQKRRLIMLPGSLSEGKTATAQALAIFKSENLL